LKYQHQCENFLVFGLSFSLKNRFVNILQRLYNKTIFWDIKKIIPRMVGTTQRDFYPKISLHHSSILFKPKNRYTNETRGCCYFSTKYIPWVPSFWTSNLW